jgi:hypothetical protein
MPFDNPIKKRVYDHISGSPGSDYQTIARAIGVLPETVEGHVTELIQQGLAYLQDEGVHPHDWRTVKNAVFPSNDEST